MTYQVKGQLAVIFDLKKINERFQKRDFVLEIAENPDYPQYVTFQLTGDRCGLIDSFNIGSELKVSFNLKGNKWESPDGSTKFFNSLDAWNIEIPTNEYGSANDYQQAAENGQRDEIPF